ncbi:MAG TPA: ABC transporter ATP-binding protein [Vicinamibacterales bacterium]|nr:ABC transporter ATP-binding protein [Vicinamibacterales bacterium]
MTPSTSPPGPPLVVEGAVKRYGAVEALAGASLTLQAGELVGLLGPNGAGKTTMINAIAGRVKLDAGAVRLFGRSLARDDKRPELGVVPQELAIYPLLTARENLEAFGRLYGVSGVDVKSRVDWALEWSDLKDRARDLTKRFSGGMKRRLNIACGLVHQPSLVLLDEPTVGVDPQSRERIYEMLDALRRAGVSILLTTHHLEEAERRCERVVIIDRGKIVAAGTVQDLVTSTLGTARTLRITLAQPLPTAVAVPAGAAIDESRRTLTAQVHDVGNEVGRLLSGVSGAHGEVIDVAIAGSTLQDVFIKLTGRELRE